MVRAEDEMRWRKEDFFNLRNAKAAADAEDEVERARQVRDEENEEAEELMRWHQDQVDEA